jgi:hypothetical protein
MTSAKNEKFRGVWEQGNLVTVTRFSTPECLSAMEAASLAATRAWQVRRCGCPCTCMYERDVCSVCVRDSSVAASGVKSSVGLFAALQT